MEGRHTGLSTDLSARGADARLPATGELLQLHSTGTSRQLRVYSLILRKLYFLMLITIIY